MKVDAYAVFCAVRNDGGCEFFLDPKASLKNKQRFKLNVTVLLDVLEGKLDIDAAGAILEKAARISGE